MKKLLLVFLINIYLNIFITNSINAYNNVSVSSSVLSGKYSENKVKRVETLRLFFEKYNSILADYAEDFIMAADYYEVDWRLLPAISGTESTFAKFYPEGTYNAYGWNSGNYHFESWSDSIWYINRTLKEKYMNKGAVTVSKIGKIYAPPSTTWARNTMYFMDKISEVESLVFNL